MVANPVKQLQIKFVNEWNSSTDYARQVLLVPKAALPVEGQAAFLAVAVVVPEVHLVVHLVVADLEEVAVNT